ncbi:hypothetical protein BDM02DRAFT_3262289 [Thelephora ganbajun]|uniref:Uncharacterized protein n=1 Tax=Thelephora ganbajun TaxID=370292 RepID=A0ACB6ZA22_THEGA|nr:hypothetical protein BDM02DRAFT_3262289 [Thelephora ganbajun]
MSLFDFSQEPGALFSGTTLVSPVNSPPIAEIKAKDGTLAVCYTSGYSKVPLSSGKVCSRTRPRLAQLANVVPRQSFAPLIHDVDRWFRVERCGVRAFLVPPVKAIRCVLRKLVVGGGQNLGVLSWEAVLTSTQLRCSLSAVSIDWKPHAPTRQLPPTCIVSQYIPPPPPSTVRFFLPRVPHSQIISDRLASQRFE